MSDWFLPWAIRLLALGVVMIGVILGLGSLGFFDAIGELASGLFGMALGVVCIIGAFVWMD